MTSSRVSSHVHNAYNNNKKKKNFDLKKHLLSVQIMLCKFRIAHSFTNKALTLK